MNHWKTKPSTSSCTSELWDAPQISAAQWPAPIDPTWRHQQRQHGGPKGTQPPELDLGRHIV